MGLLLPDLVPREGSGDGWTKNLTFAHRPLKNNCGHVVPVLNGHWVKKADLGCVSKIK